MKRGLVLSAIVAAGITAGVYAQGATLPPPEPIEKIGDNLYKIFGGGGNTLAYVREDGVVLVDTKMPGNGEIILNEVRKVTDKPIVAIINTHTHPDHVGSNDYIVEKAPKVQVVMHANGAKRTATGPMANPGTIPDFTYNTRASLGKGKDRIDLYYFGAGHTDNDTFVVFPSERAMITGDMMAWNMAPLIDSGSGGSMMAIVETLEKTVKGIEGVDKVVEGHGHVNTWHGFQEYAAFMRALLTEAKKAQEKGLTAGHAVAELEKDPRWKVFLGTQLLKGLEYGNTPKARALINANVAMGEFAGKPVPVFGPVPPSLEEQKAGKAAPKAK